MKKCSYSLDDYVSSFTDWIEIGLYTGEELYLDFNQTAKYFLQDQTLSPNAKQLVISAFAQLFLYTKPMLEQLNIGSAEDVIGMMNIIGTKEFDKELAKMFGVHKQSISVGELKDSIEQISEMDKTTLSLEFNTILLGPKGLVRKIVNYFNYTRFNSTEDREILYEELHTALMDIIKNAGLSEDVTNSVIDLTEKELAKITRLSDYISQKRISEQVKLGTVRIFLKEPIVIEGKPIRVFGGDKTAKGAVIYLPDGSTQEVVNEDIVYVRAAEPYRPTQEFYTGEKNAEQIFTSNVLLGGLLPVSADGLSIIDDLRKEEYPEATIKIYAVPVGAWRDSRVEQIKRSNEKLSNRNHEISENDRMVSYLQHGSDRVVITVSGIKASEQNVVLMGEYNERLFYLYDLNNFVFVRSDNSTERIDFSNKEHQQIVKERSLKYGSDFKANTKLTDSDIEGLARAQAFTNAFMDSIRDKAIEGFNNLKETVDVTKEFYDNFIITQGGVVKKSVTLQEELDRGEPLGVTISVMYNGEMQKKVLPIRFTRSLRQDPLEPKNKISVFEYQSSLGTDDNVIEFQYPHGKELISESAFVREIGAKAALEALLAKNNDTKSRQMVLSFDKDGNIAGYRTVQLAPVVDDVEYFNKFLVGLYNAMIAADPKTAIDNFRNSGFNFKEVYGRGDKEILSIDFGTTADGLTVIKINPHSKIRGDETYPYQEIISANPLAFSFIVDRQKIKKIVEKIGVNSEAVKELKAQFPVLAKYDLSKQEDIFKFFTDAYNLSSMVEDKTAITKLKQATEQAQSEFIEFLSNTVIAPLKERTKGTEEFFKQLALDKGAKFVENYLDFLLFDKFFESGKIIPKINVGRNNRTDYLNYNKNLNLIYLRNTNRKEFSIRPRFAIEKDIQEKRIEERTAPVKPIVAIPVETVTPTEEVKPPVVVETPVLPEETIDPGSIEEEETLMLVPTTNFEQGTEESHEEDLGWLRRSLPASIKVEGLSELNYNPDLLEGIAAGAFKDDTIYLNETLKQKGVVYHEAFHAVFRRLVDNDTHNRLLTAVYNNSAYSFEFTDSALSAFAKERNITGTMEQLRELKAEEILAEGFRKHMLKKKAGEPKTILQRFYAWLKKILSYFIANQDYIDRIYGRIGSGYYKSTQLNAASKGAVVFELIPGIHAVRKNEQGKFFSRQLYLSPSEQSQLINMIIYHMIDVEQKFTDAEVFNNFDKLFDKAVKETLQVYNIDNLLRQVPEGDPKREQILSDWGRVYKNFGFVLGARKTEDGALNNFLIDISESGVPTLSGYVRATINDVDNTYGDYSLSLLKRMVYKKYSDLNKTEIDRGYLYEDETEEESTEDDDVKATNKFDEGIGQKNPMMDSTVRAVRRLLSIIRQDKLENGVLIPNIIDGNALFPVLLNISAGVSSENIIPNIKTIATIYREQGDTELADMLQATYDHIGHLTGLTEDGIPTKNKHIYKQITESLHMVRLNYTMTELRSQMIRDFDSNNEEVFNVTSSVRILDRVLEADRNRRKNDIINNFVNVFNGTSTTELVQRAKALRELLSQVTSKTTDFLSGANPTLNLDVLGVNLQQAMADIGVVVPLSLVKLSLMQIHIDNKRVIPENFSQTYKDFYELNKEFVNTESYLSTDFFIDLNTLIESKMFVAGQKNTNFPEYIIDTTQKEKDSVQNRFVAVLKKAASYMSKYDPYNLPTILLNAENKPIYAFAKYTPMLMFSQQTKLKSLKEMLEQDPYYNHSLKDFLNDNPFFSDLLNDRDTEQAKIAKTFLDNLQLSLFGGIQQSIRKGRYFENKYSGETITELDPETKYREGKTFGSADAKSLYITNLSLFLRRVSNFSKDASIKNITYSKSFNQNESTDTNFILSAIYQQMIDKQTAITAKERNSKDPYAILGAVRYKDKYFKIVEAFEQNITQEYNRIRREFARRQQLKENYDNGISNDIVVKYNGVKDSNGKARVDDDSLKAYRFTALADFFSKNEQFQTDFVRDAKEGKDILITDRLRDALQLYAEQEYEKHIQRLVNVGVINPVDHKVGENIVATSYSSPLLDSRIITDIETKHISDVYPTYAPGDIEAVVFDEFFNSWYNGLFINQMFDGDMAMSVNNFTDAIKRYKKMAGSGINFKERGTFTVAYSEKILGFVHEQFPQLGMYMSRDEIKYSRQLTEEQRKTMLAAWDAAFDEKHAEYKTYKSMFREVFDGQAIISLMHRIDEAEVEGRLTPDAFRLLIQKHFRELTPAEIKYLESQKVVLNSQKTVVVGRYTYLKDSEDYIDRTDVSELVVPDNYTVEQIYERLTNIYSNIYRLRKEKQEAKAYPENGIAVDLDSIDAQITALLKEAHNYYRPLPHRRILHNLLNSMELDQIDMLVDHSASKNASLLGVTINDTTDRFNLKLASHEIPNSVKYLQVETSSVHWSAKFSVQQKLLIAADLSNDTLEYISGLDLTGSEKEALASLPQLLTKYNESLANTVKSKFNYFKDIIREGKDISPAMLYDLIRDGLEKQDASPILAQLFETRNGKTVFTHHFPEVRKTITFYLFGLYSRYVTDEESDGTGFILSSGAFTNVLVDSLTNEIVPTEVIKSNPTEYRLPRYYSRKLGVTTEEDENGVKTYFVECIIPKPNFESQEHERFWYQHLTKMFGVRIPTEDKRSMVVLKVVDFVNSAKTNNIIMPQLVNMLSGSDFDVDKLYAQWLSYYKDATGGYHIYGDYSNYNSEESGRFIEYLEYLSTNPLFAEKIKEYRSGLRKQQTSSQIDFSIISKEELYPILETFGYRAEQIAEYSIAPLEFHFRANLQERLMDLAVAKQNFKSQLSAATQTENRNELFAILEAINTEMDEINADLVNQEEIYEPFYYGIQKIVKYYYPILQTLKEFNLPITPTEFLSHSTFSQINPKIYQNQNLQTRMDILSNEVVFNRLYSNMRSSVDVFMDIAKSYGIDVKRFGADANLATSDFAVLSKIANAVFKRGISITAANNKMLSVLNWSNATLKDKNVIWKYINAEGNLVEHKKLGQLNIHNARIIAIIGDMLGMYADAAKDPIPAAIRLSDANTGIAASMIGVGLDPAMVMGFNFIPEIIHAAQEVIDSTSAISLTPKEVTVWFSNALTDKLTKLGSTVSPFAATVLDELFNTGIYYIDKKGRQRRNTDNLTIKHQATKLNPAKLNGNALSTNDIGFELSVNGERLSEAAQRYVLLDLYTDQVKQSSRLSDVTTLTNGMKHLNPEFKALDKILSAYENILDPDTSLFDTDTITNLYSETVYQELHSVFIDFFEQAKKLILSRSDQLELFNNTFARYFQNSDDIADTIIGFLAIRQMLHNQPGNRKSKSSKMRAAFAEDDKNLLDTFTADYWFTNTLHQEAQALLVKYPKNAFLRRLIPSQGNMKTILKSGVETAEKYLRLDNKTSLKGDALSDVINSIEELYRSENRMFVKKLFYHELARTGLGSAVGSFFTYLPVDLKLEISKYIDDFDKVLKESYSKSPAEFLENFKSLLDTDENGVMEFLSETYIKLTINAINQLPYDYRVEHKIDISDKGELYKSMDRDFDGDKKLSREEKSSIINKMFVRSIGIQFSNLDENNSLVISDKTFDNASTIRFNFNDKNFNSETMRLLVKSLRFKPVESTTQEDTEEDIAPQYYFPTIYRLGDVFYVLVSVDSNELALGRNLYNSISQGKKYFSDNTLANSGTSAVYMKIPTVFDSKALSPNGFSIKELQRFNDIAERKIKVGEELAVAKPTELRTLISIDAAKQKGTFRNKPLEFVNEIIGSRDVVGGATNTGESILIDEKALIEKFNNKAWTKPAVADVVPMPENSFNSFEEFFTFVLIHEILHDTMKKNENETKGQLETRINVEAYKQLTELYKLSAKEPISKNISINFQEEQSTGYKERTIKNASADATIAIAVDFNSAGEKLTKSSVLEQNKKYIPIDAATLEVTQERVDKIVNELNAIKSNINFYDGDIKPEPNTIFVFGSNPEGRHGAGAAKIAINQFGAKYGQGEGLQGNAYALPTKDLRVKENRGFKSISPEQITKNIKNLYEVANQNPTKQFKVAYRNTTESSLNGYTGLEMIEMFNAAGIIPSNVIFSKEWVNTGRLNIFNQSQGISLNIAGNGIYTMKGKYTQEQIDDFTYKLLEKVLSSPNLRSKITSIRTGGQTGFDEAGAKAGIKLGIPTTILAPKGWKFRNISGEDISDETAFKNRFAGIVGTTKSTPTTAIRPVVTEAKENTTRQQDNKVAVANVVPINTETKFKYYGAWYDIVVENDRGVDVKDYKGKQIAKNKLLSAFNENRNVDPQNGLPFDITHYKPRVTINPATNKPIIGIEINSYQDSFGFALTNPTHTNPKTNAPWKGRTWTNIQEQWRNYFSNKKIVFRGQEYVDVEQAYQTNKALYSKDVRLHPNTYDLMQELLEIKLRTYPSLIKHIILRGGVDFILNSTHQPTDKGSVWTSNEDNMFIYLLANAYRSVMSERGENTEQSFEDFARSELMKNPTVSMQAIEEYFKNCKH